MLLFYKTYTEVDERMTSTYLSSSFSNHQPVAILLFYLYSYLFPLLQYYGIGIFLNLGLWDSQTLGVNWETLIQTKESQGQREQRPKEMKENSIWGRIASNLENQEGRIHV